MIFHGSINVYQSVNLTKSPETTIFLYIYICIYIGVFLWFFHGGSNLDTSAPSKGRWSSTGMPRSTTGQHPEPTKVQGDDWWSGERWKRLGRGVFHWKTIGKPWEDHRKMVVFHGILWDVPSGNLLHSYGSHGPFIDDFPSYTIHL